MGILMSATASRMLMETMDTILLLTPHLPLFAYVVTSDHSRMLHQTRPALEKELSTLFLLQIQTLLWWTKTRKAVLSLIPSPSLWLHWPWCSWSEKGLVCPLLHFFQDR